VDEGNTIDPFDDLFEAFELEDGPPPPSDTPVAEPATEEPAAVTPAPVDADPAPMATVVCTSCGTGNPAHNRHCEQCGARLGSGPLPVAPAPMIRATPGGRAITVIGAVLLFVLIAVLLVNFRSDSPTETTTTLAGPTTTEPRNVKNLGPFEVEASSSFPGFPASNLIDGDDETYWNDFSLRGNDAWLEFSFTQPVQITEIELQNVEDEERLRRNYRIKSLVIKVNDLQIEFPMTMEDNSDPQRISIGSLETTKVTIEIRSTWPAENYDGKTPYDELALQSVKFFGTTE
jgi:hypothetical protein